MRAHRSSTSGFSSGNLPVHGGDLQGAEARFGRPPEGWLDLSTGINPWPYPIGELPLSCWHRLPEPGEEARLREAAARCYGVQDAAQLVAAPGTQAVIQALPRLLAPGPVAILSPTYGEHEAAWRAQGHEVRPMTETLEIGDAQAAVIVTPNNPTGTRIAPHDLEAIARQLAVRDGFLVVDEAFADCCPQTSLSGSSEAGLVVLRSFGKFYGLAGLRLGFAITEPYRAARLKAMLGPWAVSGPAVAVGCRALADREWAEATRLRLAQAASNLDRVLTGAGLTIAGGTDLFRLVEVPGDAWALWERLARQGILARAFSYARHWLRFGLPGDEAGIERLARAIPR